MSITSVNAARNYYPATQTSQSERQMAPATDKLAPSTNVTLSSSFLVGEEMELSFGKVMLGGNTQIAEWESKGLKVSDETYKAAFEVFNNASQELFKRGWSVAGSAISINRHQIVENNQVTPDWFSVEKNNQINMIGDSYTKESFRNGATYTLHQSDMQVPYRFNKSLYAL